MDNPYQAPATSGEPLPTRPYTRFRLFLDIFALVFAISPTSYNVIDYFVDISDFQGNARIPVALAILAAQLLLVVLWFVSLVINAAGAFRLRPVSIVGLVLNLVSLVAGFLP